MQSFVKTNQLLSKTEKKIQTFSTIRDVIYVSYTLNLTLTYLNFCELFTE